MLHVDSFVNEIFTSKTYVLSSDCSQDVWLVDCGDMDKVYAVVGERRIAGVLLTHGHFDHIYGIPSLLEKYPCCNICTTSEGFEMLLDGHKSLARYYGIRIVASPSVRTVCSEGSRVTLFDGIEAAVYETPGHHSSCLTFVVGDYIFTGDAYIEGAEVVTLLPGSDKTLAAKSVERILSLARGRELCCGHKM